MMGRTILQMFFELQNPKKTSDFSTQDKTNKTVFTAKCTYNLDLVGYLQTSINEVVKALQRPSNIISLKILRATRPPNTPIKQKSNVPNTKYPIQYQE